MIATEDISGNEILIPSTFVLTNLFHVSEFTLLNAVSPIYTSDHLVEQNLSVASMWETLTLLKLVKGYELNVLDSDICIFQVGDHREVSPRILLCLSCHPMINI